MTLDTFCEVIATRIPTPAEFVDFADSQGWRIGAKDGKGFLRAPPADELAVALAKMLSREPYRSNVLAELDRRAAFDHGPDGGAAGDAVAVPESALEPFPPGEPLPPSDDCPVLSAGEARPNQTVSLLGSTRPGCAYRHQSFLPQRLYPWEERRDGNEGVVYYRVYTRQAVCCLRPPKFAETFSPTPPGGTGSSTTSPGSNGSSA